MCCYKNSRDCNCSCCQGTCNNCQKTSSDTVQYIGPNLPNSGINFNDSFTVALQKIDEFLGGVEKTTTTTTSTSTSTTTSTTTVPPTTTSTTTV